MMGEEFFPFAFGGGGVGVMPIGQAKKMKTNSFGKKFHAANERKA